jgi:hypothetical protein
MVHAKSAKKTLSSLSIIKLFNEFYFFAFIAFNLSDLCVKLARYWFTQSLKKRRKFLCIIVSLEKSGQDLWL